MTMREYILSLSQHYRLNIRTAVNANELGLNGMHVRCLHVIANTPECTANYIVRSMGRDKAQIARLVKEMIGKGWIKKQASREDKRSQILSSTASGRQLQQKISLLEQDLESTILNGLSAQDVKDFHRIAGKMLTNLR
jgi:DNA-binding MarR family transcriptional regulator